MIDRAKRLEEIERFNKKTTVYIFDSFQSHDFLEESLFNSEQLISFIRSLERKLDIAKEALLKCSIGLSVVERHGIWDATFDPTIEKKRIVTEETYAARDALVAIEREE
jgi:hypothetical protein